MPPSNCDIGLLLLVSASQSMFGCNVFEKYAVVVVLIIIIAIVNLMFLNLNTFSDC